MQFPHSPAYETWLLGERRRLTATAETLLHEATLTLMSQGDLVQAVQVAGRLVSLSPYVDSHQELLIRAYAVSGDPTGARQQLQSAVRLFRRELGCDPQPSVFLAAELATTHAAGVPEPARVLALIEAGRAQVAAGATDAAIQVMRAACDEARRTGTPRFEAAAQLALGAALIGAGTARHQEGELALHRAIVFAQAADEPTIAASAYRHLAASDVLRGSYDRADRRLAAAASPRTEDPQAAVELASIGGVSLLDQGDIDGAIDTFHRGLAADPQREHPFLPIMLAHTGRAHLLAGDPTTARRHLHDSLDLARARAWAGVTAAPLALLGHTAIAEQDLENARELLEQAFARACQVSDPCWETWSAHGFGLHAEAFGDDQAALTHLADAADRSRPQRGGHLWSHVWALSDAVRVARRAHDPRADAWFTEALTTAQRCGMRGLTEQLLDPH
jgi:tetratricopeptide (TPR) repeat protein